MKKYFTFGLCLFLMGCKIKSTLRYELSSETFENWYTHFMGDDETAIATWYHYLKTKTDTNTYILRKFFPETRMMTSEIHFWDKDLKIPHGLARFWHENGNLSIEGYYEYSYKVGRWKYFDRRSGNLMVVSGEYVNGKKNGKWEYYDEKGRLYSLKHFVNDKMEGEFVKYDSLGTVINSGIYHADTIYQQTNSAILHQELPYLLECKNIKNAEKRNECSNQALSRFIFQNFKYPKYAKYCELQGETLNEITIDTLGNVKNVEVIVGLCQEFKDQNYRILRKLPSWEPGKINGKKTTWHLQIPIYYQIY
ncbi:MAG: energy transducer TonB [Saprospiraceae bacterium]